MKSFLPPSQLKYRKPRDIVNAELRRYDLEPRTDIWIYPAYPYGWDAVVGAGNLRVYIFTYRRGNLRLTDIKPCRGFRKNGTLIY